MLEGGGVPALERGVPLLEGGGFQRWKGVPAGVPAGVPELEGGSSSWVQGFQRCIPTPQSIDHPPLVPKATLDIWPSVTYTEGSAPEEADETAKAPVSSTGVVAKPKAVSNEIGGQVDTQPITWPPTASLSPEDWSESLFSKGQTNWYRCLSLRVKT